MGILVYNAIASALLAYAGAVLVMIGVLLWPAAALHAILAIWCFGCLRPGGVAKDSGGEDNAVRRREIEMRCYVELIVIAGRIKRARKTLSPP